MGSRRIGIVRSTPVLRATPLLFAPFVLYAQRPAAISYSVKALGGVEIRIGAGQPPTLVAVFATWCRQCRGEFATLDSLQKALSPKGVRVLALSVDEPDKDALVRKYIDARATRALVAHDGTGTVSKTFGTVGVPESYLVDSNGIVQWRGRGAINGGDAELQRALARLR